MMTRPPRGLALQRPLGFSSTAAEAKGRCSVRHARTPKLTIPRCRTRLRARLIATAAVTVGWISGVGAAQSVPPPTTYIARDLGSVPGQTFAYLVGPGRLNERFVAAGSSASLSGNARVPWVWLGASRYGIPGGAILNLTVLGGLPLSDGGGAMDINNEEFVVGAHGPFDQGLGEWQDEPYVWRLSTFNPSTGQVSATALSLQGANTGIANGVNEEPATPQIVGELNSLLFTAGFRHRWTDPVSNDDVLFPPTGLSGSVPIDIKTRAIQSDPFWIGGWAQNPGLQQPCQDDWEPAFWTIDPINGALANLVPEPYLAAESVVRGTNEAEDLVGYSTPEPNIPSQDCLPQAFVWQGLVPTDLHILLPGETEVSTANGIANLSNCDTVEIAGESRLPSRAMLWRLGSSGWSAFDLSTVSNLDALPIGFELRGALDVNDCGAVLAYGVTPSGTTRLTLLLPDGTQRPCPADLNGDCVVGAGDLAIILGAWGPTDCASFDADFDRSLEVGAPDLATLLGAWGPCDECNPACGATGSAVSGSPEFQQASPAWSTGLDEAIAFAAAAIGFASFEDLQDSLDGLPPADAAVLAESFRAYLLIAPALGGGES
jgi:hypothetical protein